MWNNQGLQIAICCCVETITLDYCVDSWLAPLWAFIAHGWVDVCVVTRWMVEGMVESLYTTSSVAIWCHSLPSTIYVTSMFSTLTSSFPTLHVFRFHLCEFWHMLMCNLIQMFFKIFSDYFWHLLKSTSFEKAFALFLNLKPNQLFVIVKNLKKKPFIDWTLNFLQNIYTNFNLFLNAFKMNQEIVKLSLKLHK